MTFLSSAQSEILEMANLSAKDDSFDFPPGEQVSTSASPIDCSDSKLPGVHAIEESDLKAFNSSDIEVDYDSQPKRGPAVRPLVAEAIESIEDSYYEGYDTTEYEEFFMPSSSFYYGNSSIPRKQEDMNEYDEYELKNQRDTMNILRDRLNGSVNPSSSALQPYPSEWIASGEHHISGNNPIIVPPKRLLQNYSSNDFGNIYDDKKGSFHLSNPRLGINVSSDCSELPTIYSKEFSSSGNNQIFVPPPTPVQDVSLKNFENIYGEKGSFQLSNPRLGIKVSNDSGEISTIYSKGSRSDTIHPSIDFVQMRDRNGVNILSSSSSATTTTTTASAGDFASVYSNNSKMIARNPLRRPNNTGSSSLGNSPASPFTDLYSTSRDSNSTTSYTSNPTSIRKPLGQVGTQFTYDNISSPDEQKTIQYFNVSRNPRGAPHTELPAAANTRGKPSKFSILNFFMESQPKLSVRRHNPQDALESIDYSTLYPERVEQKPKIPKLSPLKLLISQFERPSVKSPLSQVSLKPIKLEVENPMNHPVKKVVSEQEALDKEKFLQIRNFFESMSKRPKSPDSLV